MKVKSRQLIAICKILSVLVFHLAGFSQVSFSQKYNFVSYDIEDGLAQSQVLVTYQDKDHYLWFGTYGGLSRFDGKEYRSYTKADGLPDNVITSILKDRFGKVWLGTESGLACLEGDKIYNLKIRGNEDKSWIRNLTEDRNGNLWFTKKSRLYKTDRSGIREHRISGRPEYVVSLNKGFGGAILAAVCGNGIYELEADKWRLKVRIKDSILITKVIPDRVIKDRLYLLSPGQIYIADGPNLRPFMHPLLSGLSEQFLSMEQDGRGVLWIGTNNGAYYLDSREPVHFTSENGFTNNAVTALHKDLEDNIWLATDGAGIFKFEGSAFMRFDRPGNENHIIMGMAADATGKLWLGSFNNGLLTYNGGEFRTVTLSSKKPSSANIMSICRDQKGDILIGTQDGLWKYSNNRFKHLTRNMAPQVVRAVYSDSKGQIWMAAPGGCFYLDAAGRSIQVPGIRFSGSAIAEFGKDSIILGTNNGIYLLKDKKVDPSFRLKALQNTNVLCILRMGRKLLVGTFGDGLFLVDLDDSKVTQYNVRSGLLSNDIYSLATDKHGVIWCGTGRGVNRVRMNSGNQGLTVLEDIFPTALIECNQNSILAFQNSMWIGSTKGIYVYSTEQRPLENKRPYINIQSLKIYDQRVENGKLLPARIFTNQIPGTLKLNSRQNRLAISFRGIYFTNPDQVMYQYRLLGAGDEFSQPIRNNFIEYNSLSPGKYQFQVKAVVGDRESQVLSISFEITPPFYNSMWFKILMVILFVLAIVGVQAYLNHLKARKKRIRETIKHEEQQKVRRQTAEDFHDDIGNKLTRISILSDILHKKIGEGGDEQRLLLQQIKEDASTLYKGTKEILWALDPQSDNLFEILDHVRHSGTELFEGTGIAYTFSDLKSSYKRIQLPMEYSRNISMIFKEALSNILKHAGASSVCVEVDRLPTELRVLIIDNGNGFKESSGSGGHGLNNIRMRAKRINSSVNFTTTPGKGTVVELRIDLKTIN